MITGHQGPIQDLEFSPFHENILASASHDKTVKIWNLPDNGLTEGMKESATDLVGHTKRTCLVNWHPSAEYTLASAGLEGVAKVWDV